MKVPVKKIEDESTGLTVADYVRSLQEDKQVFEDVNNDTDDYLDGEETVTESVENEPETLNITETLNTNELAEVLVNVFNVGFNIFARTFSRGHVDKQEFEATREELTTIRKPLAKYLKTKNIEMSAGTVLLIAVLMVYAPKTFMLISAKKQAIKELQENDVKAGEI